MADNELKIAISTLEYAESCQMDEAMDELQE